jgi:transposase
LDSSTSRSGTPRSRHDRVEAPWLLEGPINRESFRLHDDQVLIPTLQIGDIVSMDNLGSDQSSAIRWALRAVGDKLFFLPKYSPDLNPIEMLFSKLKHGLRKAAKSTKDAVYQAIVDLPPTVEPNECANWSWSRWHAETAHCFPQ